MALIQHLKGLKMTDLEIFMHWVEDRVSQLQFKLDDEYSDSLEIEQAFFSTAMEVYRVYQAEVCPE